MPCSTKFSPTNAESTAPLVSSLPAASQACNILSCSLRVILVGILWFRPSGSGLGQLQQSNRRATALQEHLLAAICCPHLWTRDCVPCLVSSQLEKLQAGFISYSRRKQVFLETPKLFLQNNWKIPWLNHTSLDCKIYTAGLVQFAVVHSSIQALAETLIVLKFVFPEQRHT